MSDLLNDLTQIDCPVRVKVSCTSESFEGTLRWDSEEQAHFLDQYKIVADYEEHRIFIVEPVDDTTELNGFLNEITSYELLEGTV